MQRIALTRKFVAITVAGFACGGAAWAAAAVVPPSSGARHAAAVESTTTTVVEDSTTTTVEETTTTAPETTTTAPETTTTVDGTTTSTVPCNHGSDVSRVAHEAPRGPGGEHGKAVSAVAHVKCPGHDAESDATDGDHETDDDNGAPVTVPPAASSAPGHGHHGQGADDGQD